MAYDEGLAQLLRDDLADLGGITERKMFGGLCFQLNGHMVCGVHKGGGMFRPGKPREAEALKVEGTAPLSFTGRPMGGMIDANEDAISDDTRRRILIDLSLENVKDLPPK
ncbi:TfoX/Sxy family protein [Halocynthiibacter sp. C4]|uniref:TfoX/Sxy family protein n=1 Tax=Halocynthiibacter sp. C4 TaxID=2992758 RepID=UPI00237BC5A6|nr:TfoX/Sxy family protein [Halocynthiibacter sp. C4]MDE0589671.1 TfoX/Sxy family protein [Halocynthiibacter sp. C4]